MTERSDTPEDRAFNLLRGLHKVVLDLSEHFDKPITDENLPRWLALNSAQEAVAKFLSAPQSETASREVDYVKLGAGIVLDPVPDDKKGDVGPWVVRRDETRQWRVCSENFKHDVELIITGDFKDEAETVEYAADIARRLSAPQSAVAACSRCGKTPPLAERCTDDEACPLARWDGTKFVTVERITEVVGQNGKPVSAPCAISGCQYRALHSAIGTTFTDAANRVLELREKTVMSKYATQAQCRAARDALWEAAAELMNATDRT